MLSYKSALAAVLAAEAAATAYGGSGVDIPKTVETQLYY